MQINKTWILSNKNKFKQEFFKKNPPGSLAKLQKAVAGVAGAGGLGSNIAVSLVRAGVQNLVIADFDRIELSNLNRQQFFFDQVGQLKVNALKENLLRINPLAKIKIFAEKVTRENAAFFFKDCDILLEAFDRAENKVMLAETWSKYFPDKYIIIGSGLAGAGMNEKIKTQKYDKIIICGDQKTQSTNENGLLSARVAAVANLQANCAIEILLKGVSTHDRSEQ